jgi:hypothetical protein
VIALAPFCFLACESSPSGDPKAGPSAAPGGPAKPPEVTGVPVCDQYLAAYECHMHQLGLEGMPKTRASILQMKDTYRVTALTPEGREAITRQCTGLLETLKANPDAASCSNGR